MGLLTAIGTEKEYDKDGKKTRIIVISSLKLISIYH